MSDRLPTATVVASSLEEILSGTDLNWKLDCRAKSLIGQRFGLLTVIRHVPRPDHTSKTRGVWAVCQCDCGKFKKLNGNSLKVVRSCGCLASENIKKAVQVARLHNFKPVGHLGVTQLLDTYRRLGARRRKLQWDLTREQFEALIFKNCHFCDLPPVQKFKSRIGSEWCRTRSEIRYNGIDRLDNKKGYTTDNCVTCCKQCNFAKRDMTLQQWGEWIRRIRASSYEPA